MVSIHVRPPEVNDRVMPGHWEGDLIKGAGNKSAVGELLERTTRLVLLCRMSDATADSALAAFTAKLKLIAAPMRRTLTDDQGKEMALHRELVKASHMRVYLQRSAQPLAEGQLRQHQWAAAAAPAQGQRAVGARSGCARCHCRLDKQAAQADAGVALALPEVQAAHAGDRAAANRYHSLISQTADSQYQPAVLHFGVETASSNFTFDSELRAFIAYQPAQISLLVWLCLNVLPLFIQYEKTFFWGLGSKHVFKACQLLEMPGKNKYYRHSKISEARFGQRLRLFAMDLTATDAAQLFGVSMRSANAVYQRIRVRLARQCAAQLPFSGELVADESCVGPKRIRGKRGRGAGGKTIVFGLPGRGAPRSLPMPAKPRCRPSSAAKLSPITSLSVIHTDGWRGDDGRVDWGLDKHFRVNSRQQRIRQGLQCRHVNGIESFCRYARHRLAQFHGVRRTKFAWHLKETAFRFNHRHLDLYKTLLKLLRDEPL